MDVTYKLITVVYYQEGLRCCLTQYHIPESDMGHYCVAITNADGHVLSAFTSSGACPQGKVTEEVCKEILIEALRFNRKDWTVWGWMS